MTFNETKYPGDLIQSSDYNDLVDLAEWASSNASIAIGDVTVDSISSQTISGGSIITRNDSWVGYYIFKDGSMHYAKNMNTHQIESSGSDFSTFISGCISDLFALTNGSGGRIHIENGNYIVSSTIDLGSMMICLEGSDFKGTKLTAGTGLTGFLLKIGRYGFGTYGTVVKDLYIYGNDKTTPSGGIELLNTQCCIIDHVLVDRFTTSGQKGLYIHGENGSASAGHSIGGWYNKVNNCRFLHNNIGIRMGCRGNANEVIGGAIEGYGTYATKPEFGIIFGPGDGGNEVPSGARGPDTCTVYHTDIAGFQYEGSYPIKIESLQNYGGYHKFFGVRTEENRTNVYIEPGANGPSIFVGCLFYTSGETNVLDLGTNKSYFLGCPNFDYNYLPTFSSQAISGGSIIGDFKYPYDYIVYADGVGNYYLRDTDTNKDIYNHTNATNVLNEATYGCKNTGGAILVKSGRYGLSGHVVIHDNTLLAGEGYATRFGSAWDQLWGSFFWITGSNVIFRDCMMTGSARVWIGTSAGGRDIENILIENIYISNQYISGLGNSTAMKGAFYVEMSGSQTDLTKYCTAKDITFRNCHLYSSSTFGFELKVRWPTTGAKFENILFDHCSAKRCGIGEMSRNSWGVGFTINEGSHPRLKNITLRDCIAEDTIESGFHQEAAIPLEFENVVYENCIARRNGLVKQYQYLQGTRDEGPSYASNFYCARTGNTYINCRGEGAFNYGLLGYGGNIINCTFDGSGSAIMPEDGVTWGHVAKKAINFYGTDPGGDDANFGAERGAGSKIIGNRFSNFASGCISLTNVSSAIIKDNILHNVCKEYVSGETLYSNIGIYIGARCPYTQIIGNRIIEDENATIVPYMSGTLNRGIVINAANHHCIVDSNFINFYYYHGIDINSSYTQVTNNHILSGVRSYYPALSMSYSAGNSIVRGNQIRDINGAAMTLYPSNIIVDSNIIDNCYGDSSITYAAIDGHSVDITNNTIVSSNGSGIGIFSRNAKNVIIDGNILRNCGGYGIRNRASGVMIINNYIEGNLSYGGILLESGSRCLLDGNYIDHCKSRGIWINCGNFHNIINNVCTDSWPVKIQTYGIDESSTTSWGNCVIKNNYVSGNITAGILWTNKDTTIVKDNYGYTTENGGWASVSDGGVIAHGCATTPNKVYVTPSGSSPLMYSCTVDGSNITVYHSDADARIFSWKAEV